ncbi:hypothetical protein DPMN_107575 [Dreissena polymorpha]|uniref:Uncharacterized protein n=1 Tax=Dreissena polymorpha TaxID=45954 RepID=A0A9D4QL29_DREPO|nr:hypothetical protein DPMN_107575 [Dreissena polymorpha]
MRGSQIRKTSSLHWYRHTLLQRAAPLGIPHISLCSGDTQDYQLMPSILAQLQEMKERHVTLHTFQNCRNASNSHIELLVTVPKSVQHTTKLCMTVK